MLAAFAFDSVWTAHVMRRRNDQEIRQLAMRMFELHSVVFLIAGSAGALFAHEIFMVLVGPQFVPAYALVPPLMGCYALYSCARNFTQGIQLRARPRRSALTGLQPQSCFSGLAYQRLTASAPMVCWALWRRPSSFTWFCRILEQNQHD